MLIGNIFFLFQLFWILNTFDHSFLIFFCQFQNLLQFSWSHQNTNISQGYNLSSLDWDQLFQTRRNHRSIKLTVEKQNVIKMIVRNHGSNENMIAMKPSSKQFAGIGDFRHTLFIKIIWSDTIIHFEFDIVIKKYPNRWASDQANKQPKQQTQFIHLAQRGEIDKFIVTFSFIHHTLSDFLKMIEIFNFETRRRTNNKWYWIKNLPNSFF